MRSRRTRLSNRSNTKNSYHSNDGLNSPEDGSVINKAKMSVYELNKKIQDNLKDSDLKVYDNVNNRKLG